MELHVEDSSVRRVQARQTSPQRDDRRLRSPMESSINRPSPAEYEAPNWNPMTTPLSEWSATPSLRHTDSPSVFSHAASNTPTSQTSYSPFIAHSPHFGPGAWNSPVKSVQDLRLGFSEDGYQNSTSTYQNGKSNDSLSNQQSTGPIPELAHLMIDAVLPKSNERQPPARPSRDDTPSLDHLEASPVVISNLSPGSVNHHRRQSSSSAPESTSRSEENAEQRSNRSPPRRFSRALQRPSTSDSSSSHRLRYAQPVNGSQTARSSPAPANSPKPTSKFGFFHRKDRTDSRDSQEEAARQLKKGPTAGTGHEGYGKYAGKGRNGSSTSLNATNNRSPSAGNSSQAPSSANRKSNGSSTKGNPAPDDFLAQRLAPVYLRGSGPSPEGHKILRSDSGSSVAEDEPAPPSSVNSPNLSNASRSSFDPSRPSKKHYATPVSATTSISSRTPSSRGRGSWGSVGRGPDRSKFSREHGNEMSHNNVGQHMPVSANEASFTLEGNKSEVHEDPKAKKSNWSFFSKPSQRPKTTQKWNLFQRSQTSASKEEIIEQSQSEMNALPSSRAVAHYAMQDNNQHFDFEELEDLMKEADALQLEYQSDRDDFSTETGPVRPYSQKKSLVYTETAQILASHLKLSPELYGEHVENGAVNDIPVTERDPAHNVRSAAQVTEPRQSRLAQVGRIPKVVSRRDRSRKLSDQSFSRPFDVSQPRPSLGSPDTSSQNVSPALVQAPVQPEPFTTVQAQEYPLRENQSASTLSGNSRNSAQDAEQRTNSTGYSIRGTATEFLNMPMRKDSDLSTSSSSGTPYFFPSTASTAVVPSAVSPVSEDEVWQEYDDFIDHVLTPINSRSESASIDAHLQTDYLSPSPQDPSPAEDPVARSKTAFPKLGEMASSLRPDLSPFLGTRRRSQVFSGFEHPAVSPVQTGFTADDTKVKSDPSRSAGDTKSPKTFKADPQNPNYGLVSSMNPQPGMMGNLSLGSSSTPPTTATEPLDTAEAQRLTPRSMANLRFGALMTSKWLSFGRVLFSPGHFQLNDKANDRILIIDGLGKDWSYYCALTYTKTTVYSLGAELSHSHNRQSLGAWQPLTNHRHFSHPDISANFPFPKNFFSVVVFRFPVATTEASLRTAICECKRVLQPGGYLEISSLDLDLTNMGNKARRAVRALKTQMQTAVPDVCLKPMSDNMQYLLGRRGFENLSRCVVGVPVAGVIADSRTNSRDEQDMSFTELASDTSKTGDEAMTKLVAKVGRWWYTNTYETCVLPNGDVSQSIWNGHRTAPGMRSESDDVQVVGMLCPEASNGKEENCIPLKQAATTWTPWDFLDTSFFFSNSQLDAHEYARRVHSLL